MDSRHFLCSHSSNIVKILQFVKDSRAISQDYDQLIKIVIDSCVELEEYSVRGGHFEGLEVFGVVGDSYFCWLAAEDGTLRMGDIAFFT